MAVLPDPITTDQNVLPSHVMGPDGKMYSWEKAQSLGILPGSTAANPDLSREQLTELATRLSGGDPDVTAALTAGYDLGNTYFGEGSLGRLATEMSEAEGDGLSLARNLVKEMTDNPRTAEQQAQLDRFKSEVTRSSNLSPDVQRALDMYAGMAGQGLTNQEKTLYREEGEAELDRNQQTLMRMAQAANIGAGRRGAVEGAALPGIARERMMAQDALMRQMRIDDIALKAQRLDSYAGYAAQTDAQRASQALGANTAYTEALRNQRNSDVVNKTNAGIYFNNTLGQIQNRIIGSQVFNLNNRAQEIAGRIGSLFTAGGMGANTAAMKQAYDIAQAQIAAAQGLSGGGRGGDGSEGGTGGEGGDTSVAFPEMNDSGGGSSGDGTTSRKLLSFPQEGFYKNQEFMSY